MKKILATATLLSLALAVAGCGSSSKSSVPPSPLGFIMWVANAGNNSVTAYNTADAEQAAQPGGYDFTPLATLSNPYGQTFLDPPGQAALSSGGNLWVADSGGNSVIEISSTGLAQSGEISPSLTIANPAGQKYLLGPHGVALDGNGDLWVSNFVSSNLVEYTAQQLTSNPTQQPFTFAPAVIISNPTGTHNIDGPATIEFDAEGDLWVANLDNNTVVEYGAGQLTSSGSPTPETTIANPTSQPPTYLLAPHGLAFDGTGDLFVVNLGTGSPMVRYSAAQLAGGGTITQAPSATYTGSAFNVPAYAEFDSTGDLWVSNTGGPTLPGNLVEFSAASLASSGSPTPQTIITSAVTGTQYLYQAFGLAFDSAGNLIVTNRGYDFPVIKYSAAQIAATGSPDPAIALNNPSASQPAIYNPTSLALDSSEDLWIANNPHGAEEGNIVKIDASSIVNNNFNVKPALTIQDPTGETLRRPDDIQFDGSGNLWAVSSFTIPEPSGDAVVSELLMYSAASLTGGNPTPSVKIVSPPNVLLHFNRMHFDNEGDLWLAGDAGLGGGGIATPLIPVVVEYTKAQLASSGAPNPTTVISGSGTHPYFENPVGLGFDAVGDLWVTSGYSGSTLNNALAVAYLGKNLGSSSTPVASIGGPGVVATDSDFDTAGNLFLISGDSVYEYTAANVALVDDGGAIPDAQGVIAGPLSGLDYPTALAIEK